MTQTTTPPSIKEVREGSFEEGLRLTTEAVRRIKNRPPDREGKSKRIWRLGEFCLVELKPTLRSYTFAREAALPGTEVLRLDFFEHACRILAGTGLPHAFRTRIDRHTYLCAYCEEPPIEVILKNFAVGSTLTLYPGLFATDKKFSKPVVKFDFRVDPQDLPLPDDYLRELGLPVDWFRRIARRVNEALALALPSFVIVDFCLIYGRDCKGEWQITSEISPDSMRIRNHAGESFDKDLFRRGEPVELLRSRWELLADAMSQAK